MIYCEITYDIDTMIHLAFYTDTGKFGTEELLDDYELTSEQLLDILQEWRANEHTLTAIGTSINDAENVKLPRGNEE